VTALEEARPPGGPAAEAFRHEAFLHRGEDEFVDGVLAFVREGLERDEDVVVVEPGPRGDLLRAVLGDAGRDVRWLDMTTVGANPGRLVGVWETALAGSLAAGRRLRGVGEPAFAGRRPQELVECHLHELLLNRAFADGPGWRLMCPYDERRLPTEAVSGARHTHPEWSSLAARGSTGNAVGPLLEAGLATAHSAPLPPPSGAVLRGEFGAVDVPAVRRTVVSWARSCGLAADQVELLELAASELATNSVLHGGGSGSIALWEEPHAVVLEVSDAGVVDDPLAGRRPPAPDAESGAGLYLLHQLADLLQLRSSSEGTTVRVTTWR
jgi:anti-sigma regulatory factor (Ser/Thr protein kinase)